MGLDEQTAEAQKLCPPAKNFDSSPVILTVFLSFIFIAFMLLVISSPSPSPSPSPSFKNSLSIVHQVPEGHVGVYWRGGALLKTITEPGFHLKMPFITLYEPVRVVHQAYMVTDVPCGTKGGVMINFEKIQVVNRLHKEYVYETLRHYGVHYAKTWIDDKIHHQITQFYNAHSLQQVYTDVFDQIDEKMRDALQDDCAHYALGLEIINVRVTKPTIPDSIRRSFEQQEEERINVLIADERQKVAEKEAETSKRIAISEAEKNANVRKILMERKLLEKESCRCQQEIENQIFLESEKSKTDAAFYRATKEAEANRLRLTPEFLRLKHIEALGENTKISFEEKVLLSSPLLFMLFQCLLFSSRNLLSWCKTFLERHLQSGRQIPGSQVAV